MKKNPANEELLRTLENTLENVGDEVKRSVLFRIKTSKIKVSGKYQDERVGFIETPKNYLENKLERETNLAYGYKKIMDAEHRRDDALERKYRCGMLKIYFLNKEINSGPQIDSTKEWEFDQKYAAVLKLRVIGAEIDPMYTGVAFDFLVDLDVRRSQVLKKGDEIVLELMKNREVEVVARDRNDVIVGMQFVPLQALLELDSECTYMLDFQGACFVLFKIGMEARKDLTRNNAEIFARFEKGHELLLYDSFFSSYCGVCSHLITVLNQGYRCQKCRFTLHKKCTNYLFFGCQGTSPQVETSNFTKRYDIAHVLRRATGSGIRWCSHCGERIASGRVTQSCENCGLSFHDACALYLFPSCGLNFELRVCLCEFEPLKIPISKKRAEVSISDFSLIRVLGRGSFGKVILVEHRKDKQTVALKIIKKECAVNANNMTYLEVEKSILELVSEKESPFLMQARYCFQDRFNIYFGTEYLSGGDLLYQTTINEFSDAQKRLWLCEIVLGIGFLHANKIIHRDIKLDNVMITPDGHAKIIDFGLCKIGKKLDMVTYTVCGTLTALAPEIIKQNGYNKDVDWWAFGVLMFEFYEMELPFCGVNSREIMNSVLVDDPVFKSNKTPECARDLVLKLLEKNPKKRLGSGEKDVEDVKKHEYFKDISWELVEGGKVKSDFQPGGSKSNFDKELAEEPIAVTPSGSVSSYERFFVNFPYG